MIKRIISHRIGVVKRYGLLCVLIVSGALSGCNSTPALQSNVASSDKATDGRILQARALQYDRSPRHYKQISVTEFAAQGFIALHQYLPIGTRIKIINPRSYRESIVIISGKPDKQHRQKLVLSHKAARKLGLNHRKQEKILYKVLPKKTPYIQTQGTESPMKVAKTYSGKASYYAHRFHGRKTANGERYNMHAMTCAHKKLPFNSEVRVTNRSNGRSVTLRVNDRGPYAKGRIIDVSLAAAKQLGMMKKGVVPVKVEVLKRS
jgi:rare lipoprotein A